MNHAHIELAGTDRLPSPMIGNDGAMLRITVTNTFHGTKTTVIAKACTSANRAYKISHRQIKGVLKRLCGINGCLCGGEPHTHYHTGNRELEISNDFGFIVR